MRRDAAYVLALAGVVALVGGYGEGWKWTGFQANGQLWDWLNLLLLPVVLGTIPLWIQDKNYIGKSRQVIYGVFIVAWTGFVIAGYLIPISWTGFSSQKLWNWIVLLVLPAVLAITAALTSRGIRSQGRLLRPYEKGIIAALAAGWIVTVIGGYAGVDLDWLCRKHPVELAHYAACAAGVPDHPASGIAQMGLGQCGRAGQQGTPCALGPGSHARARSDHIEGPGRVRR